MSRRSRFTRTIGLGLTIAALGASTAGAMPADPRTAKTVNARGTDVAAPDQQAPRPVVNARGADDAIRADQPQTTTQNTPSDVRSPDAVAAGQKPTGPVVDMRTPDAKDHGEGRGTFSAPDVTVVKVVDPAPTSTGFDWGDAGIGAGGLLGLVLIALGTTAAVAHRRHTRTPSTV
jgi:hypothetical protein